MISGWAGNMQKHKQTNNMSSKKGGVFIYKFRLWKKIYLCWCCSCVPLFNLLWCPHLMGVENNLENWSTPLLTAHKLLYFSSFWPVAIQSHLHQGIWNILVYSMQRQSLQGPICCFCFLQLFSPQSPEVGWPVEIIEKSDIAGFQKQIFQLKNRQRSNLTIASWSFDQKEKIWWRMK